VLPALKLWKICAEISFTASASLKFTCKRTKAPTSSVFLKSSRNAPAWILRICC